MIWIGLLHSKVWGEALPYLDHKPLQSGTEDHLQMKNYTNTGFIFHKYFRTSSKLYSLETKIFKNKLSETFIVKYFLKYREKCHSHITNYIYFQPKWEKVDENNSLILQKEGILPIDIHYLTPEIQQHKVWWYHQPQLYSDNKGFLQLEMGTFRFEKGEVRNETCPSLPTTYPSHTLSRLLRSGSS